jgi:hypothetical protein
VDPQHGHALEAGEEMHSELDAIQERLRELKRELDARESLATLDEETGEFVATKRAAADH